MAAVNGEITLLVAQSPRYYPHVERHLSSLQKVFRVVRLLYWEKDAAELLYQHPGVACERLILPFGNGGAFFFLKLMVGFHLRLLRMRPRNIEAIDPYALIPARCYSVLSGLIGKPVRLTYFSMEYFSELPSLRAKPFKRRIWKALEKWGAKGASAGATVCDSIALHLREDFKIPIVTVRNVPPRGLFLSPRNEEANPESISKAAPEAYGILDATGGGHSDALHIRCGLAYDVPILIYQGMLQEGRGLETAIRALASAPGFHFAVVGDGPLLRPLRELAEASGCSAQAHFLGEIGFHDLVSLTRCAFAGLAPFQALSASYLYSLPGKLFEYIQAGIPVVTCDLPEIRKIVEGYDIGICLVEYDPMVLAEALLRLRDQKGVRERYLGNMARAQADLCWEAEEAAYLSLYERKQDE